jgi:hypothetical protein
MENYIGEICCYRAAINISNMQRCIVLLYLTRKLKDKIRNGLSEFAVFDSRGWTEQVLLISSNVLVLYSNYPVLVNPIWLQQDFISRV